MNAVSRPEKVMLCHSTLQWQSDGKSVANEEHLQIIRQGVAEWNDWRKKNPELLPDLSGAKLSKAYLDDANLVAANLSGADLSGANLRSADLACADLGWSTCFLTTRRFAM